MTPVEAGDPAREPRIERCIHVYRDKRCNYKGLMLSCDKTFGSCRAHDNTQNFGGYPEVENWR